MSPKKQGVWRTLTIVKEGQRYIFRYRAGGELAALYAVIECVTDGGNNLELKDLLRYLSRMLKEMGPKAVIEIPSSVAA